MIDEIIPKKVINNIDLKNLQRGMVHQFWLNLISDPLGRPIQIPVIIAHGSNQGKVLGLTAAIHGNELNGIPVISKLFKEIDPQQLSGTIIGVPVVNIPSFLRKKRRFNDGQDLNHIMPGKPNGNASEVYANRFFNLVVKHFNYLIDLHTASSGRVNSYYIRADMKDEMTRKLAVLQNAQIIVHNPPSDGTLRGAADEVGIHAITLEVGNPSTFQKGMIRSGLSGILNVLSYLNMVDEEIEPTSQQPVLCKSSYWIYTDKGGLLRVLKNVTEKVRAGELIAIQENIFGDIIRKYIAPEDGIIIGKSISPVNISGGRILHLGIPA